jgi:hypothetical protein
MLEERADVACTYYIMPHGLLVGPRLRRTFVAFDANKPSHLMLKMRQRKLWSANTFLNSQFESLDGTQSPWGAPISEFKADSSTCFAVSSNKVPPIASIAKRVPQRCDLFARSVCTSCIVHRASEDSHHNVASDLAYCDYRVLPYFS